MVEVATTTGGSHKVPPIAKKPSGAPSGSQTAPSLPVSTILQSVADQEQLRSKSSLTKGSVKRKRQTLVHLSPQEKAYRRSVPPSVVRDGPHTQPGGWWCSTAIQVLS